MEERDAKWREELRVRDVAFREESEMQEYDLCKMLERRDQNMKEALVQRDQEWLNSLHYYSESLRLMTQEQINIRGTMESLGKKKYDLKKENAEILDWAIKTISGKKKVQLPQINISDYVPYIIVPPNVQNVNIPFIQLDKKQEIHFFPPRQFTNIPVQTKRIRITPRTKPQGESSKSLT